MSDIARCSVNDLDLDHITKGKVKNPDARTAIMSVVTCIGNIVSSDNVFFGINEENECYLEFHILITKEIHLSTLEHIIRSGSGFVKDVICDISDSKCTPLLRIVFKDQQVGDFVLDQYEPPMTVIRKCIIKREMLPQVERDADFLNVQTLIETVFYMRTVMPKLDFECTLDKTQQSYNISIVGVDKISKSFINYLAGELANTFLETIVIGIDVRNTLKVFKMRFVVRMSTRPPRFVFSNISNIIDTLNNNRRSDDDIINEPELPSVWKRTIRELDHGTDESEVESRKKSKKQE
jgi:hypothetical protein